MVVVFVLNSGPAFVAVTRAPKWLRNVLVSDCWRRRPPANGPMTRCPLTRVKWPVPERIRCNRRHHNHLPMAVSAVQYPVPFLMNIYILYAPLGLRSKLKKVFPFEKLFKDKLSSKNNNNNNSSDHTNKADLHKTPSSLNDPIKSLIRPLEVPKWDGKPYEAIKRNLTIFLFCLAEFKSHRPTIRWW